MTGLLTGAGIISGMPSPKLNCESRQPSAQHTRVFGAAYRLDVLVRTQAVVQLLQLPPSLLIKQPTHNTRLKPNLTAATKKGAED
jgi:hypothetical protein